MDEELEPSIEKKRKQFVEVLNNASDESLIALLEGIREKGEAFMVAPIIDMLFSTNSHRVKEAIVSVLADLKNQQAADDIASAINIYLNHNDLHLLVSACWQSRINFTKHISLFINLLSTADLQTCIEASSVIENMLGCFSEQERAQHLETLKRRCAEASDQRASLIKALVAIVDSFEDEPDYD